MEEVRTLSFVKTRMWMSSFVEAMVANTILSAWKSLASLLLATGSLLTDVNNLLSPKLTAIDGRFPLEDLYRGKNTFLENKNANETEDDEDDEDANDGEEDGEDEDYSGEEGEEERDPEDDPKANGVGGNEDGDEDDDNDDEEEDDDEDGEDEEEEDEEDEDEAPQPPLKKRK